MIRPFRLVTPRRNQPAILPMDREDAVHRARLRRQNAFTPSGARRRRETRRRLLVAGGSAVLAGILFVIFAAALGWLR